MMEAKIEVVQGRSYQPRMVDVLWKLENTRKWILP
jgi:hypothetical protein